MGRISAVCPWRPRTSARFACPVLRRDLLLTRDAYDRFLPSAASISSTRASFVLDEVAPRSNGIFPVPPRPPALKSCLPSDERSSTQRFHAAGVALGDRRFGVCFSLDRDGLLFHHDRRRPTQCRARRAVSVCRLADPSAVAHTPRQRLDPLLARPMKTSPA